MKFIRNARFRDRIFDLLSKALLIAFSALACLWMVSGAHASPASITGIKGQSLADDLYAIDFSFSQKITQEAVAVEFERNFIQISLRGVSAYPARTENINQAPLHKVFTYQYQPDLARARVLLKGPASAIKDKASWELTPQGLRISVRGSGFKTPLTAKEAPASAADSLKTKAAATTTAGADSEEERIVQEILNEVKPGGAAAKATVARNPEDTPILASATAAAAAISEDQPVFASKAGGSDTGGMKGKESAATRIFASLLLVIGIIGVSAVTYRRFALGKGTALFQRQPKVIDVIATQSLGPKRSVALIKVLDQYMVVGMSGDGMTLLSNLGSDVKIEKFLDQIGGPGASFNDTFEGAMTGGTTSIKSETGSGGSITHKGGMDIGIRSAIKKRIEGFKPL